jgi:hypothetical protein
LFLNCRTQIGPHGIRESQFQRVRNKRVTDRNLENPGYLAEPSEILQIQVVPRIHAKTQRLCSTSSSFEPGEYGFRFILGECLCIGLRVQFDAVGSDLACDPPLITVGIHKETDACTEIPQLPNNAFEPDPFFVQIPPVVRRKGVGAIRHQRALGGLYPPDHFEKLREGIALNVELNMWDWPQIVRQFVHIGYSNVALIGPRVHGNAMSASHHGLFCSPHHTRYPEIPRVPQQSDFVQVYAKSGH